MLADSASRETPRLTRTDARAVGSGLRAPRAITRTWRRGMARLRSGRLPAMIATFSDGRRFRIDAGDLMYEQIYRLGEYEPEVTETIRSVLRPGDFVVDIGANHGWYVLVMARSVGSGGRVWAVEPGAAMLASLRANLELNPGLPVAIHRVAVGDAEGEVLLHHFPDLPHGHASLRSLGHEGFETEAVRSVTLDSLVAGSGMAPALVKLDVEGSELVTLRGSRDVLSAQQTIWVVEVNLETSAAFGYAPAELLEAFPDDYAVYRVAASRLVREDDPAAAPHGTTWLCVPPALRDRIDGLAIA